MKRKIIACSVLMFFVCIYISGVTMAASQSDINNLNQQKKNAQNDLSNIKEEKSSVQSEVDSLNEEISSNSIISFITDSVWYLQFSVK